MFVLISLNIVLLSSECIYYPDIGMCIGDDTPLFHYCMGDKEPCDYTKKGCKEIDSQDASYDICPQAAYDGDIMKCIYDSANNKCKEVFLCSPVDEPTEENCKNALTSDDTKKICSYDKDKNSCQEVDKPTEKTNDGRAISKAVISIVFISEIILLSFCIFHFIKFK